MNSATTTTMSRSSQISQMVDTSPSSDLVSLRNFVVDEDRANLGSDLWKSVDKNAFILAQRDAIEAYNLSMAMRLSQESAAKEERMRLAQAEEAARSLARSWNVDSLQSALLKNSSVPSSSTSSSPPRSSTRHPPSAAPSSRPILKRNPSSSENVSNNPSSASSSKASPTSGSATAAETSSQKRRKASISSSSQSQSYPQSQPHYSYSTSNYSYNYHNQSNTQPMGSGTSQASVQAQQQSEGRKHSPSSSASSRDIQAGQILNPKESSPRTQSPSSSASAQAAAAEREKGKEKENQRSRSNSNSNSNSSSRKRSSSSAAHQVHAPQPQVPAPLQVPPQSQHQSQQQQQHGPRDIFAPVQFNCVKCGNMTSSIVHSQPSLALTSPDPFAHPFASALHVVCNNRSCGAVHCRGCLQVVKCRDVEHPPPSADSQALVPVSSTSPPTSNPASPIRPTFTFSRSHQTQAQSQRACAGGPGCALWTCCPTVRVIAIWEALRAFDALFGAEAGFQVANQQWRAGHAQTQTQGQGEVVGRQYREAYIKMVIAKADKSMRRFEDGFVRVLKVVASWLQVSPEPSAQFSRDDRRQSTILDPDHDHSQSPDTLLLHLAGLFLSSHFLEVLHTFLSNRNVKDWMSHAETYLDVLDVVGKMMDCGLGFLLKEVSGAVSLTPSSSSSSASASGFYNPFAAPPSLSTATATTSQSQSPPLLPLSSASSSTPSGPALTLYDLISQLESYRAELKRFLAKVSFGVTVDKASKLHEAITYLVLQLVVGEF